MANQTTVDPNAIEGRQFTPSEMRGGLDQESSKFTVRPGTLSDCLNYNSSTRGYQRAQGLLYYDGTIDTALSNLFLIGAPDSEATFIGSDFKLGEIITWGTGSTGKLVYYRRQSSTRLIGIVDILGELPAAGDTITNVDSSSTLVFADPLTYPPAPLATAVYPDTGLPIAGTITDYLAFLNNNVNYALVNQQNAVSGTFSTYHGAVPGVGAVSGGWQFDDDVYVVRDAYSLDFDFGAIQFRPGDEIQVPYGNGLGYVTVRVASVTLTSSFWANGNAEGRVVLMPSENTSDIRDLDIIDAVEWIKDSTGVDNVARTAGSATSYGGLLWRGTLNGWEWVDTGWTLDYDTGTNAPNVKAAPLFIADLLAAPRVTASTATASGAETGSLPAIAWGTIANITADDAAYATCALPGLNDVSKYLRCYIPAGIIPQEDVRIVGVEVTLNAKYTTAAPIDTEIRLINENVGGDEDFYLSEDRARREALAAADADIVYGSGSDLWGLEEISAEDLNSGNMGVVLQYTDIAGGSQVDLDYVSFVVSYVPKNEKVWFWDGSTDVSTGVIHAYQIEDGTFVTSDAEGSMSVAEISAPTDIGVGMEIRSEPAGAGLLIANVQSNPVYNVLPAWSALKAVSSQYETIVANYYENDESEAVYGVTGAGPAFNFDGTNFAWIKVPLEKRVDKPRHVAFHIQQLALGYKEGSVIISAPAAPNDFAGVDGASSWGVGDAVTGLISLSGNVLGVFSETSIRTLEGAADDGTMRTIASTTGSKEYTMQDVIGPYFADNRGVSSVATTDRYGDFDMGRITDPIRTWLQDRIQEKRSTAGLDTGPVASVAIRNKNQYRLFFADGYVLVIYFRADGSVEPTLMHYDTDGFGTDFVPTFVNSFVMSTGQERTVMGTENGEVFIVDGADCIMHPDGITFPNCWVTLNPINFGHPERLFKNYHAVVQGRFYGAQTVSAWGDSNYVFNEAGAAQSTVLFGSYDNAPVFVAESEVDSTYLPILTDGFSMKLQTTMDGSKPHTFQSVLFRSSAKGIDRNRASKAY